MDSLAIFRFALIQDLYLVKKLLFLISGIIASDNSSE